MSDAPSSVPRPPKNSEEQDLPSAAQTVYISDKQQHSPTPSPPQPISGTGRKRGERGGEEAGGWGGEGGGEAGIDR